MALVLFSGLIIRVISSDWTGMTADEANGIAVAVTGSWTDMIQHLREDGNPPLFYSVMRLVSIVFGDRDFAYRAVCVFFSLALVPCTYFLVKPHAGKTPALAAAAMVALCPPLIRYSDLVRMYCMLPLLSLASTYFCLRLLSDSSPGKGLRWGAPYAVITALLIYCHHWGFFLGVGQVLTAGLGLAMRWWSLRQVGRWFAYSVLVALAYLPWLPNLLHSLSHNESPWAVAPAFSHLVIEMPPEALIGRLSFRIDWQEVQIMFAAFWVAYFVFLWRRREEQWTVLDIMRYVIVFGLLVALFISSVKPAWRDRYLVTFTPMICICFAIGLQKLGGTRSPWLVYGLPLALWLPIWWPQYVWLTTSPESSVPAVTDRISREFDRSRDLVVVSWQAVSPAIVRALPNDVRLVTFPDLDRVRIIKWEGFDGRLRDDARMLKLLAIMEETLSKGGRIWLVDSAHPTHPVGPPGSFNLQPFDFSQVEHIRMDQVRGWLTQKATQEEKFSLAPGHEMPLFLSVYHRESPGSESTGDKASP